METLVDDSTHMHARTHTRARALMENLPQTWHHWRPRHTIHLIIIQGHFWTISHLVLDLHWDYLRHTR